MPLASDKNEPFFKSVVSTKSIKVALAGNPNSGKTTLFNSLTGLNQKIGNFPGVTVDKKTGKCELANGKEALIIDLPGTYSLYPKTIDESITHNILCDSTSKDYPDAVVIVVDASNLKRNLLLATQIIDLKIPCLLVLNMMDLVLKQKRKIDIEKLAEKLGIKVIPMNARENSGISQFKKILAEPFLKPAASIYSSNIKEQQAEETIFRYKFLTEILQHCVSFEKPGTENNFTSRADKILTHRVWGFLIFSIILFLIFQSIYNLSAYPMEFIEWVFIKASVFLSAILPEGLLSRLIIDGIIAGLSGILIFIPQIAFLFAFIGILEDTGYMARVSFIMDRLLRKFGLNGKSVIPLLSGTACAIPAIMSTRTIDNWKERMITIMVTPLVSCSARIPVFSLLIALSVPQITLAGIFNLQGIALMALYVTGFIAALGTAFLFKILLKTEERSTFIMEMPVYRSPRWSSIGLTIYEKTKTFVFEAGKIIIAVSIILWVLSSFGPGDSFEKIDRKFAGIPGLTGVEEKIAAEKLKASYVGRIGKIIEPVIEPLGFDWKIGIALITSFAAREVFVGTMATIYSVGDPDNYFSVREKMAADTNETSGEKTYSKATGFSLMIFFAFALQCMSTVAVTFRETKHWKWPLLQFFYMGVLAYSSSFIVYNLFK